MLSALHALSLCSSSLQGQESTEYHMTGNIGGELNLALWFSSVGLPNFILPNLLHDEITCTVVQLCLGLTPHCK